MNQAKNILQRLKEVPKKPGIYLWKDKNGRIIYVGKAKNLYNRMHQYFKGSVNSYKTYKMVSEIEDFDIFITRSDKEAYLLEKTYIEKHTPKYNILLLDDKNYGYIEISLQSRLDIKPAFRIRKNSKTSFFYGPIVSGGDRKKLVKVLQRFFLYKQGLPITDLPFYQWEKLYHKAIDFLKLKDPDIIQTLTEKMNQAASIMDFEAALEYRDSVKLLQEMKEKQIVEISDLKNIDVFSIIVKDDFVHVYLTLYRFGVLVSHNYFYVHNLGDVGLNIDEILSFYYRQNELPNAILIDKKYADAHLEFEFKHKIEFPKLGVKAELIKQANLNNQNAIETKFQTMQIRQNNIDLALQELGLLTGISQINNIYIFDNSNLNNTHVVGVGMCFKDGQNYKNLNRKFDIQKHLDDSSKFSDSEYMQINVNEYLKANSEFFTPPNYNDLFIVDGSIIQINSFLKALKKHPNFNFDLVKVIGLVKNEKHETRNIVLRNGTEIEIINDKLYHFLSYMQTEVDKYAKQYHDYKFRKSSMQSQLTQIKGVGEKSELKLLNHFKDYSSIYNASEEQLAKIVGQKIAKAIKAAIK
ncbi:excinuclease ABC subunit UvrC [Mycoplasmopsis sturni]|uniref:excinuclease ABC subunit UvrC n=1 Tax=Mycoplasmopsis sturni TaxID=39047 RepID=UPI00056B1EDF|nr:excinuclease ABC subunit UvrC [Mycoplasmopsis sturni]